MSNESFFLPSPDEKGEPMMRTNVHAMVDLETFGTAPGSAIIAIGAVLFNPLSTSSYESMLGRSILLRVSVTDAIKHGAVDPSTIQWWFEQDDAAIKALVGEDAMSLQLALLRFRQFCEVRNTKISDNFFPGHIDLPQACALWAKGPDFDCKILEAACDATREAMPVGYHQYRCVRTVTDLGFPDPEDIPDFGGTQHNAQHDAVQQAMVVQASYQRLGLTDGTVFDTF